MSQTSFGHISTNSLMILMVSMATESPQKNLLMPVTSQDSQYWPRYQVDQQVTTMVLFIKLLIS